MINKRTATLKAVSVFLLAATLITGCGGKKKEISVDPASLASSIATEAVTSDTLTQTQASMLPTIYYIDESAMSNGSAYMSAGSTACEVVVIECKDASQAGSVKEKFESRVKSQSELYASYNQEEVAKLDKAIIKTAGKYAVLVVCDDTAKAEQILKEAGF